MVRRATPGASTFCMGAEVGGPILGALRSTGVAGLGIALCPPCA